MAEEVSKITQLKRLEQRDWQLWSIAIVMILSLTVTIIGIQAPEMIGASEDFSTQLKLYLSGLSILVLLFCGYVLQSIHTLRKVKSQLTHTVQEKGEIQSLLDTVKERTEKLEASEANYRNLLDRNADGFVVVDGDTIVKYINPAGETLLGTDKGSLLGRPFAFPVFGYERTEVTIERPEGGTAVAEMRVMEATWEGQKAWLASLRDITVRKHAEDTLKKANEGLKRLDQMKSDFVSTVSHELRTPLTSIKNASNLLASGKAGPINENQKRFCLMAIRNIDRLTEIVNDLLDLSKVEAGKMQFRFAELDMRHLMNHVTGTFQPRRIPIPSLLRWTAPKACLPFMPIRSVSSRSSAIS